MRGAAPSCPGCCDARWCVPSEGAPGSSSLQSAAPPELPTRLPSPPGHPAGNTGTTQTCLQGRYQEVFCRLAHHPEQHAHPGQEGEGDKDAAVARAAVEESQVVEVVHVGGAVLVVLNEGTAARGARKGKGPWEAVGSLCDLWLARTAAAAAAASGPCGGARVCDVGIVRVALVVPQRHAARVVRAARLAQSRAPGLGRWWWRRGALPKRSAEAAARLLAGRGGGRGWKLVARAAIARTDCRQCEQNQDRHQRAARRHPTRASWETVHELSCPAGISGVPHRDPRSCTAKDGPRKRRLVEAACSVRLSTGFDAQRGGAEHWLWTTEQAHKRVRREKGPHGAAQPSAGHAAEPAPGDWLHPQPLCSLWAALSITRHCCQACEARKSLGLTQKSKKARRSDWGSNGRRLAGKRGVFPQNKPT